MSNAVVTSPWTTNPIKAASHAKFIAECKTKLLEPFTAKRDELRLLCADSEKMQKMTYTDPGLQPILSVMESISKLAYGIGALFSLFGDRLGAESHIGNLARDFDLTFDQESVDDGLEESLRDFSNSFAVTPGDLSERTHSLIAVASLMAEPPSEPLPETIGGVPGLIDTAQKLTNEIVDKFTIFLDEFLKAEPKPYNQEPS